MRRAILPIAAIACMLLGSHALADSSGETVMKSPGGLNNGSCVAVKSRYVSHVCMDKVTVRWKIGTLLNEPTINAAASWELWSRIGLRYDNSGGSPDLMRAISTLTPQTQAALRKLRPTQLQFGATVGFTNPAAGFGSYGSRIGANPLKIRFDTGRMTLSGGGFSFNTTGSPGWDKLFFRSSSSSACPATMLQTPAREEGVSADEAKDTVKKGNLSLSDLMICQGDFAGLSELDSVLGETCDAWQPGTQAHRECLGKKEPKKDEAKDDKKTADKPKPQAAKPATRLDNRQLAMLDKAVQKSVDRSSGGVKGDALDRALTKVQQGPPTIAPSIQPNSKVSIGSDASPMPVGTWTYSGSKKIEIDGSSLISRNEVATSKYKSSCYEYACGRTGSGLSAECKLQIQQDRSFRFSATPVDQTWASRCGNIELSGQVIDSFQPKNSYFSDGKNPVFVGRTNETCPMFVFFSRSNGSSLRVSTMHYTHNGRRCVSEGPSNDEWPELLLNRAKPYDKYKGWSAGNFVRNWGVFESTSPASSPSGPTPARTALKTEYACSVADTLTAIK